jgi:hypothetical protein
MEAYTDQAPSSKSSDAFHLTPQPRVTRLHLVEWVTRALATMRPWTWELAPRLGRTWHRNPNHDHGEHSKERGEREAQLARDVARLHRARHFIECQGLPWRLRASYLSVIGQVHRLLGAGDWWKPRRYVDRATGEVTGTIYLPEDTWSAQTALAWCVAMLDRLWAGVPRMTEKATPRYRPEATASRSEGCGGPEKVGDWLARATARWCGPPGAQPELPARG